MSETNGILKALLDPDIESIGFSSGDREPDSWIDAAPVRAEIERLIHEKDRNLEERDKSESARQDLVVEVARANERERKLREALAEVRMHLVSEQLPGAHRTEIPLSICDAALAETQGGSDAKGR
jgi:hypothetical protein